MHPVIELKRRTDVPAFGCLRPPRIAPLGSENFTVRIRHPVYGLLESRHPVYGILERAGKIKWAREYSPA